MFMLETYTKVLLKRDEWKYGLKVKWKAMVLISLRLTLKVCEKDLWSLLTQGMVAQGDKKEIQDYVKWWMS